MKVNHGENRKFHHSVSIEGERDDKDDSIILPIVISKRNKVIANDPTIIGKPNLLRKSQQILKSSIDNTLNHIQDQILEQKITIEGQSFNASSVDNSSIDTCDLRNSKAYHKRTHSTGEEGSILTKNSGKGGGEPNVLLTSI